MNGTVQDSSLLQCNGVIAETVNIGRKNCLPEKRRTYNNKARGGAVADAFPFPSREKEAYTNRYGRTTKPNFGADYCSIDEALFSLEKAPVELLDYAKACKPTKVPPLPVNGLMDDADIWDAAIKKASQKIMQEDSSEVDKVLKIISNKSPTPSPEGPYSKLSLKTYVNKRKFQASADVVETFSLPDFPIYARGPESPLDLLVASDFGKGCNGYLEESAKQQQPQQPQQQQQKQQLEVKLSRVDDAENFQLRPTFVKITRLHIVKPPTSQNLAKFPPRNGMVKKKTVKLSPVAVNAKQSHIKTITIKGIKHAFSSKLNTAAPPPPKPAESATLPQPPQEPEVVEDPIITPAKEPKRTPVNKNKLSLKKCSPKPEAPSEAPLPVPETPQIEIAAEAVAEIVKEEPAPEAEGGVADAVEKKPEIFETGDVVWARVGKYPYWPCILVPDTNLNSSMRQTLNPRKKVVYHVKYFADNGRTSWAYHVMPFNGLADFELKKDMCQNNIERKLFYVKPSHRYMWSCAVHEALEIFDKPKSERLQAFEELLKNGPSRPRPPPLPSPVVKKPTGEPKKPKIKASQRVRKKFKILKKFKRNLRQRQTPEEKDKTEEALRTENPVVEEAPVVPMVKKSPPLKKSEPEIVFNSIKTNKNYLFYGVTKNPVCEICEEGENVLRCKRCNGTFHKSCSKRLCSTSAGEESAEEKEQPLEDRPTDEVDVSPKKTENNHKINGATKTKADKPTGLLSFDCFVCTGKWTPPCFVCNKMTVKSGSDFRKKCTANQCGKYYHPECLKDWPQTAWTGPSKSDSEPESFTCPRHVCHTCTSDDPRGALSRSASDKLAKCLRCPTAYHCSDFCVAAGTEILSCKQIICTKHAEQLHLPKTEKAVKPLSHLNANWCFICAMGGSLICCEACPTSFHVECLGIDPPEGSYICEECESGRLPLYNEIVWAKLGKYRWWPAQILHPCDIPINLESAPHNYAEFVVKFFGTRDHYWVNRGRVFLFQEGDTGDLGNRRNKSMEGMFAKAIAEASLAHKAIAEERRNKVVKVLSDLKPPPYTKIKNNRPVGNVRIELNNSNVTSCDCDPNSENPCGPDSDCLNRLLLTECNPSVCPAKELCKNQQFERRIYPELAPYKTNGKGWGLRTLVNLTKGDFIIEYVGEMIDEAEYQKRLKRKHIMKEENYYFLTIDKDRMIDAGPKGNLARFMNHSCQPNCETQKWTVNGDTRIGLFALCDIPANSELTFNYHLECSGKEKKICRCDAPNCSGFIGVKAQKQQERNRVVKVGRKRRNRKRKKNVIVQDMPCFVCKSPGGLKPCSNKSCGKFYHTQCVADESQSDKPGKWFCPCHSCNICNRRTIRCCYACMNSYCVEHAQGNIKHSKKLGFTCVQHEELENAIVLSNSTVQTSSPINGQLPEEKPKMNGSLKTPPNGLAKKRRRRKKKMEAKEELVDESKAAVEALNGSFKGPQKKRRKVEQGEAKVKDSEVLLLPQKKRKLPADEGHIVEAKKEKKSDGEDSLENHHKQVPTEEVEQGEEKSAYSRKSDRSVRQSTKLLTEISRRSPLK